MQSNILFTFLSIIILSLSGTSFASGYYGSSGGNHLNQAKNPAGGYYSSQSYPSGGSNANPSGGYYSSPSYPSGGSNAYPSGGYYSSPSYPSGGSYSSPPYFSSGSYSYPSGGYYSSTAPSFNYGVTFHQTIYPTPTWIKLSPPQFLPAHVVAGVCRIYYRGGLHPGQIVGNGNACSIGWGGRRIVRSHYEALVSRSSLQWVRQGLIHSRHYFKRAIIGGYENGRPLYICQVNHGGGMVTGKMIDNRCNIGWGNRELAFYNFNLLVSY